MKSENIIFSFITEFLLFYYFYYTVSERVNSEDLGYSNCAPSQEGRIFMTGPSQEN